MVPGQTVQVGEFDFTFKGVEQGQGPNYSLTKATFVVNKDGQEVAIMYPENREYPISSTPSTEAAIHTTFFGDLYAVVGDPVGTEGGYVTRLYWNPLVVWMWVGAIFMMAATAVSLSDRRYRIGVSHRRKVVAKPPVSQPAGA
jgi:cytochrome c-type biogenesis protein CcmF